MRRIVEGVVLECVQGNIVQQPDMEAIVNAANRRLCTGGGVAGAIHRAAGPRLEQEAVPLGPIEPGQAVITGGYDLPNKYVIHCLGRSMARISRKRFCWQLLPQRTATGRGEGLKIGSLSRYFHWDFGYPIEDATKWL